MPWHLILPDASWRMAWDVVILGLVVFAALVVPVRLGFELVESEEPEEESRGLTTLACHELHVPVRLGHQPHVLLLLMQPPARSPSTT